MLKRSAWSADSDVVVLSVGGYLSHMSQVTPCSCKEGERNNMFSSAVGGTGPDPSTQSFTCVQVALP